MMPPDGRENCPEVERLRRLEYRVAGEGAALWAVTTGLKTADALGLGLSTPIQWVLLQGTIASALFSLVMMLWVITRMRARAGRLHRLTWERRDIYPCIQSHEHVKPPRREKEKAGGNDGR